MWSGKLSRVCERIVPAVAMLGLIFCYFMCLIVLQITVAPVHTLDSGPREVQQGERAQAERASLRHVGSSCTVNVLSLNTLSSPCLLLLVLCPHRIWPKAKSSCMRRYGSSETCTQHSRSQLHCRERTIVTNALYSHRLCACLLFLLCAAREHAALGADWANKQDLQTYLSTLTLGWKRKKQVKGSGYGQPLHLLQDGRESDEGWSDEEKQNEAQRSDSSKQLTTKSTASTQSHSSHKSLKPASAGKSRTAERSSIIPRDKPLSEEQRTAYKRALLESQKKLAARRAKKHSPAEQSFLSWSDPFELPSDDELRLDDEETSSDDEVKKQEAEAKREKQKQGLQGVPIAVQQAQQPLTIPVVLTPRARSPLKPPSRAAFEKIITAITDVRKVPEPITTTHVPPTVPQFAAAIVAPSSSIPTSCATPAPHSDSHSLLPPAFSTHMQASASGASLANSQPTSPKAADGLTNMIWDSKQLSFVPLSARKVQYDERQKASHTQPTQTSSVSVYHNYDTVGAHVNDPLWRRETVGLKPLLNPEQLFESVSGVVGSTMLSYQQLHEANVSNNKKQKELQQQMMLESVKNKHKKGKIKDEVDEEIEQFLKKPAFNRATTRMSVSKPTRAQSALAFSRQSSNGTLAPKYRLSSLVNVPPRDASPQRPASAQPAQESQASSNSTDHSAAYSPSVQPLSALSGLRSGAFTASADDPDSPHSMNPSTLQLMKKYKVSKYLDNISSDEDEEQSKPARKAHSTAAAAAIAKQRSLNKRQISISAHSDTSDRASAAPDSPRFSSTTGSAGLASPSVLSVKSPSHTAAKSPSTAAAKAKPKRSREDKERLILQMLNAAEQRKASATVFKQQRDILLSHSTSKYMQETDPRRIFAKQIAEREAMIAAAEAAEAEEVDEEEEQRELAEARRKAAAHKRQLSVSTQKRMESAMRKTSIYNDIEENKFTMQEAQVVMSSAVPLPQKVQSLDDDDNL